MMHAYNPKSARTPCSECPLASLPAFGRHDSRELAFVSQFKAGEFSLDARTTILEEGARSAHLYTVLSGWGFRYKELEDGRRQILNYVVPGDLIGLQGTLMKEMQHSVEALTTVTLCVFERDRLKELFEKHPDLAFDLTWIAAREERLLDEHLLSVGRRTALERAAYLLAFLALRATSTGLASCAGEGGGNGESFSNSKVSLPITQQHVADTLGLSLVHTNKTMRKLVDRDLIAWRDRICEVRDIEALAEIAGWTPVADAKRPYI